MTVGFVCKVPLMVVSEGLTLVAGVISTVLCGKCECRPPPRRGEVPILLIHGSGFNQSEWLPLRGYLGMDGRVGPVYTVNYGGLLSGDKTASIHDLAVTHIMPKLEEIFRDTRMRRVILVGHSLGGLIAAEVAERVAGVGEVIKVIAICSPFHGVPLLEYGCVSSVTDEQMRVGSTYLMALSLSIQEKEARGAAPSYHYITSELDLIVPSERAALSTDQARVRVFGGIEGHWGIVLSPRLWRQVKEWIL